MKGVFIRGMKMPESCLYCEFRKKIDQDNFRCKILGYPIEWRHCYIQERDTDCPLIEVEIDTDKNVGTTDVPDTNVGDKIFIQSAIEAIRAALLAWSYMPEWRDNKIIEAIKQLQPIRPGIIKCKDCKFWAKQEDSIQGRCALLQIYPTGEWFCGNARRKVTE